MININAENLNTSKLILNINVENGLELLVPIFYVIPFLQKTFLTLGPHLKKMSQMD